MTDSDPRRIAECIRIACRDGIASAFDRFDARIPIRFDHYFESIESKLIRQYRYLDAARSLMTTAERYGWAPGLIDFGARRIVPRLAADPSWFFAASRHVGEELRARLTDAARFPVDAPRQRPLAASPRRLLETAAHAPSQL
jgi:hypothetical protein